MSEKTNAEKVLDVLKEMDCSTQEFIRLVPTAELMEELVHRYDNGMFLATIPRREEDKKASQGPMFKYNGNIGHNLCMLHAALSLLSQEGLKKIQRYEEEDQEGLNF